MIIFIFLLFVFILSVLLIMFMYGIFILKDYKGSNIKCGGDMILNGRRIPKRKDLDVQDVCVTNGKFKITYTDGSVLIGDDDPAHDMYTDYNPKG